MSKSQLLIVDDDQSLLEALKSALNLRMDNIIVTTVESGDEALEFLKKSKYDVVITDIKMPGMDGLSLLQEIRKRDPYLPTLLITGHGQHDLAVQALRGGAFDFIQKPLDRDYVVAALNRAIQVREQHKTIVSQQKQLENHAADLEEKVRDRTRKLQELNQSKDQFLAMLSHELRNPLACIRHALDLLNHPDERQLQSLELFEVMSRQASHMAHLLDDLLDVSRISRNEITLRKAPVDLLQTVKNAINAMDSILSEMQHTLHVDFPAEHIVVDGDQSRLEQVFVNLLQNAAKYTNPGGQIRISVSFDRAEAVVMFQDDGIGISPSMLDKVFELFSQADHSLARTRGGLGIGLTLVQKLAHLHDGNVSAFSAGEGQGSQFVVRLPARLESQPHVAEHASDRQQLIRHRVILVEDNVTLAKLTSELLRNCDQDVVAVVSDGYSAIRAATIFRPDYVLLDIGIPEIDGYEVARRLRQYDQFADLKLVALTGYGREEDRLRSKAAGFDCHLTKPISIEALTELFSRTTEDQLV